MSAHVPAHLEVAGLIRAVQAQGGFATVIARGERDAGTLLVVTCRGGAASCAWERMPQADGTRGWAVARREEEGADPANFADYLARRRRQDDDLWIVELDIANGERFIAAGGTTG